MKKYMVTSILLTLLLCVQAHAEPAQAVESGRVYRIAYLENGDYWLFRSTLQAFKVEMANSSLQVEYPDSLHLSPGWNASQDTMLQAAKTILAAHPDLVLAAGTGAAHAFLQVNDRTTPILDIALADPIAAGVMRSSTEVVADNMVSLVVPDRWKNMYRVFHDVIGFKKLGIMYPAGQYGRAYSAVDDAYAVSKQAGFQVVEAVIDDESVQQCRKGIEQLHQQGIDAFFIGPLNCFDWTTSEGIQLIDELTNLGIPTFARDGSPYVQAGALMGFSTWDFSPIGKQLAGAAVRILKGEKPKNIAMVAVSEPLIALNLHTARLLGLNLPFDVLVAADQIFEQASQPARE